MDAIKFIEEWAETHPIKTRQSEMLKMYPVCKKMLTVCLCYAQFVLMRNIREIIAVK